MRRRFGAPWTAIRPITGTLKDLHAGRAERWFGGDLYRRLLQVNHHWPIPVLGAGGPVWAYRHSLLGHSLAGRFASAADYLWDCSRRLASPKAVLGMGFGSLADFQSEGAAWGKRQICRFDKSVPTVGAGGDSCSLARVASLPPGNATAAAFAAGESPDGPANSPSGLSLAFRGPQGGDTLHLAGIEIFNSQGGGLCLFYDRFYQGNWNLATTPQSVSGTPTRYQSTASKGAFISAEVSSALGTGSETFDITYIDQDGNAAEATTDDLAKSASQPVDLFPVDGPDWHFRLNSGDTGVRALTNVALSVADSGNLNVYLGMPLALVGLAGDIGASSVFYNCVNSMFNMAKIEASAAIVLASLWQGASGSRAFRGAVHLISG